MLKNSNTYLQGIYELAAPPSRGCIVVNKLVISAEQQRHEKVSVLFSDDSGNEFIIFRGYCDFRETSENFELCWKGWRGAKLIVVVENNFEVNVSADVDYSMECSNYTDWLEFSENSQYKTYELGEDDEEEINEEGGEQEVVLEKIKQIEAIITPKDDFIEGTFQTWVFDDMVGIFEIIGRVKADPGGGVVTHSWRFDVDKSWTVDKAKKWLDDRNISFMTDSLNEELCIQFEKAKKTAKYAELEMEIFAVGTWNGDEYSEEDLDKMVESFNAIGLTEVKPYLKLGHNEEQELAKSSGFFNDGMPAMGWMDSLKKVGNKLFAHFRDVPRVIAELVERGGYKRVSSEIYWDYVSDVSKGFYDYVVKAVALLGGNTPAVTTLQDVLALYKQDDSRKSKTYEYDKNFKKQEVLEMADKEKGVEDNMELEKQFESKLESQKVALEAQFAEEKEALAQEFEAKSAKIKEETLKEFAEQKKKVEALLGLFAVEDKDVVSTVAELKSKKVEYIEKAKEYEKVIEQKKIDEVATYVEGLIRANRMLPVQRDYATKILYELYGNTKELTFSKSEEYGIEEKKTVIEAIKAYMEMVPDLGLLKEFSSSERGEIFKSKTDEFDALVERYQQNHPEVSFGKAQVAIQKIRPDLFEEDNKA